MIQKVLQRITKKLQKSEANPLLTDSQICHMKSFGDLNPDEIFYVIRQESTGRGFFSILSSVLCHLDIADKHNFVPVIDFENFKNVYNESHAINGTFNSWEYYFEPLNHFTLKDVYRSKNVIFSDNGYPSGYDFSITTEKHLLKIFHKYIKYKPILTTAIEAYSRFLDEPVLGVHFRGQEMRTAPGHWFPPSKKQMAAVIDKVLEKYHYPKIFVVSEDAGLLEFLKKRYPNKIISCDHYRTVHKNAYKEYPRQNHFYLLGLEVMVDMMLLSKCNSIIGCTSNVVTFARFLNNGMFESEIQINNGPNSRYRPIAKVLWYLKNLLPARWGGFSVDDSSIIECKNLNG